MREKVQHYRRDRRMGRIADLLLLVGILAMLVITIPPGAALRTNLAAVTTAAHVARDTDCAASDTLGSDSLRWTAPGVPEGQTPYLRAVTSAAGARGAAFPPPSAWDRDQRLYEWLRAQSLIRQGDYPASLPYLRRAQAASTLMAATHAMYLQGDLGCYVFTRLLVDEIATGISPDAPLAALISSLIDGGRATAVIEGYRRALAFRPDRADWHLTLTRALLAVDRVPEALTAAEPVLAASPAERASAEALFSTYYAGKGTADYQAAAASALASHFEAGGRPDLALPYHRLAAESAPDRAEYTLRAARAYLAQGWRDEATGILDAYLQRHPDDADVRALREQAGP